jgi:hypothetical protein
MVGLLALISLALVLIFVRLTAYESIGTSISTYDTQGFITSGHIPFPSAEFFTSNRPATISLFYKVLEPSTGYQVTAFSSPAEDIFQPPAVQPGLQQVAVAQGLLSIASWLLLAAVIARRLRNPALQIIEVMLVLAFGFSPTIAEWDAVLLSEPISQILFVILLAISIELIPRLSRGSAINRPWNRTLLASWGLALLLWVFARDTNAYILPVFIVGLIVLLILKWKRTITALPTARALSFSVLALSLLFLVHNFSLQQGGRWINPFFNNILHNVFPYPDHLAFFKNKGMPVTDEVWALRNSPGNEDAFFEIPELMAWTTAHGSGTYMQFLLAFPGWTLEKFFDGVETSFSENRQPFFFPNEGRTTPAIAYVGDLLHPKSSSVIWVDLVELIAFGFLAFRRRQVQAITLFALFVTFFLGEVLMLFVSIQGDALGVVRHAMGSVMPLRLSLWLLPPLIFDIYSPPIDELTMTRRKPQKAKA